MNAMVPLIAYSREHPELSVQQALRSLVDTYAAAAQAPNIQVQGAFPPGGVQGPRPQGMMQSPALSNAGLPMNNGVVATPSPHQSNMAPPMAPSMSQTSHQSGSNTSPNVSAGNVGGKRRRSTAAGLKDEDGINGAGAGGGKVKQSPRMTSGGGNKRMKGS
jgi:hypothetical protein